jgi:hypothetical protein
LYARYETTIETETALLSGTVPRIQSIRADLLRAVEQIDALTADQARAQLTAADRVSTPAASSLTNERLKLLLAAVVGASRTVDELAVVQMERLQMRCNLLEFFRNRPIDGLPAMAPHQEVLDVCADLPR